MSENRSWDIAEEALHTGARGYVVKSDAACELLSAVEAVLQGKLFVSATLTRHGSSATTHEHAQALTHCHEVAFYADDAAVVNGYAHFIETALKSGHAVIVVVNERHRASFLSGLQADGVNVSIAIEQGSYIALDAAEALSKLTVDDTPDPVRCAKVIRDLIAGAARVTNGEHRRLVACGETAPTLLSKGNVEGAIKLEHLWDEITRGYGVQTLCGYLSSAFSDPGSSSILERICAEHSAVHRQALRC